MPKNHFTGGAESLLAMGWALRGTSDSLTVFHAAEQCLRSCGSTRSVGTTCGLAWLLQGYCLLGRRADAAPWQDVTEPVVESVGDYLVNFFPTRTLAGIAAACAGDWDRAENWHRESLQRVDATPALTIQIMARYWYADMLIERRQADDLEQARDLLHTVAIQSGMRSKCGSVE